MDTRTPVSATGLITMIKHKPLSPQAFDLFLALCMALSIRWLLLLLSADAWVMGCY